MLMFCFSTFYIFCCVIFFSHLFTKKLQLHMHFKQFPLKVNRYNSCCIFLSEWSSAILKYLKTYDSGKPNDWRHMIASSCNEEVDSLLPKSKCVRECKYGLCKKLCQPCTSVPSTQKTMREWKTDIALKPDKEELCDAVASPCCQHWRAHETQGLILSQTGNSLHNPGNKQERTAAQFDWAMNGRCRYKAPL